MPSKRDILIDAANACIAEFYSVAQPKVSLHDFKKECKIYSNKYREWETFHRLSHLNKQDKLTEKDLEKYSTFPADWEGKSITECIGPRPYEFYYVPSKVQDKIRDSYVFAYELDKHQGLLDTIKILKDYCEKPIVDKYVEDYTDDKGNHHPGHRDYDHPDNLYKEIAKIVSNYSPEPAKEDSDEVVDLCSKFFAFLDMAGKFFNWNGDLNSFNITVWDISPNTNKQAVIDNWEKYRNKKIEIDDTKFDEEQDYD